MASFLGILERVATMKYVYEQRSQEAKLGERLLMIYETCGISKASMGVISKEGVR